MISKDCSPKSRTHGTGVEHVRKELSNVRTGRASIGLLDERAGRGLRLEDAAQSGGELSIPEPSLIVAQPFDPSTMPAIEKAIRSSISASTRRQTARSFASRFRP